MKKKGFTLIELLAVIVILAIIALIITPIVSNVIDSSRKAAFRESVGGVIDSTTSYALEYILNHNDELNEYPIVFTCDGESCKTTNNYVLTFKGNVPKSGRIIMYDSGVLAEYITDGKYCAYGYKWDLVVEKSCGDVDVSKPTITAVRNGKIVTLTMTDNESGIDKYCVNNTNSVEGCSWITPLNTDSEEYEISSPGTWYFFVKDKKGNVSDSISMDIPESAFNYDAVVTTYDATLTCSEGYTLDGTDCKKSEANSSVCGSTSVQCNCETKSGYYCTDQGYDSNGNWVCNGSWAQREWQECSTCSQAKTCMVTHNEEQLYVCDGDDILDEQTCTHYACPDGGTLAGTICVR